MTLLSRPAHATLLGGCAGLLLLALAAPADAQRARDCSRLQTQLDMNFCAADNYKVADAELNRLWKRLKPAYDRMGRGDELLQAQRAWLRHRDSTCKLEADDYRGGSIAPMVYSSCLERLTRQRNREFHSMLRR